MLHALPQWQKTVTSTQRAEFRVLAGVPLMFRRILVPPSSGSVFQDEWLGSSPPQHDYWRRWTAMCVDTSFYETLTQREKQLVCVCVCVFVSNLWAVVCYYWNMSTLKCTVFKKIILRSSMIIFLLCRCVIIGAKIACSVFVKTVRLSACISTAPTVAISVKFGF